MNKKYIFSCLAALSLLALLLANAVFVARPEVVEATSWSAQDTNWFAPFVVAATPEAPVSVFPSIFLYATDEVFEDRETWFTGAVSIYSPNNPEHNRELLRADIRGRGNTTWWLGENKRPLRFRFPSGQEQGVLQFEHEARTWILLADNFDKSLMRNYSALYFGTMLEHLDFTPSHQHVHVYFNGEYMGVYLLTDERDIGPGRASLVLDDDPTVSEFFLELDWRAYRDAREWYDFVRVGNRLYDIRFPNSARRSMAQGEYVQNFLYNVENAILSGDWERINRYIDVPSFIDLYIVEELFQNGDGGVVSIFMQIRGQGADRRLFMGPLWDFDLVAGNAFHQYSPAVSVVEMYTRPYGLTTAARNVWYWGLIQVPEFATLLQERFSEVSQTALPDTINTVRHLAYQYQAEFARNFERHPVLGTAILSNHTPEMVAIDTHMGHVEFLVDFLEQRASWLNGFFYGLAHEGAELPADSDYLFAKGFGDVAWIMEAMLDIR